MTMTDDGRGGDGGQPPRQLSVTAFIAVVAALTLAAAGIGFLSGMQILSSAPEPARSNVAAPAGYLGERQRMESAKLQPLAPIVTNLAGSPAVWIRIEASLAFQDVPADADALAARISEDIIGFLRTVSVKQIEGPIGFQNLSEDLNERVRVRSDGRVSELIIQGLIIE